MKSIEYADEYVCPRCGWDPMDGGEQPVISNRHGLAMMYWSWTETYACPNCETEFSFETGT